MKPVKAVIFDMDGVIIDSEPRHEQAFREIFAEMGYGDRHGIDFPAYYGRTDRALWEDFIALHHPSQSLQELSTWKQQRFLDIIRQEQPVFPSIPALIEKLSKEYPLGLASGSLHPVIDVVLSLRNLRPFFKTVVSIQDVPRAKPFPDVFLHAAQLLDYSPGDCVALEDSAAGIEAALAAGMQVIAITNTLPAERLSKATHVVRTFEEIEDLLLH